MIPTEDYKQRLYKVYKETHPANRFKMTGPSLNYMCRHYARTFGPLLPQDKTAKILELGCGLGSFLYFLKKSGYTNTAGIDMNSEHVSAAQNLGLQVIQGNALDVLRSNPGTYDCIITIDFLEHFKKEELFPLLDLIRDALKNGPDSKSSVIGRVPNADGLGGMRIRYGDLTHELAFTPGSLWQLFRATGFKEVTAYPEEPIITGIRSFIRFIVWQPIKIILKIYLFVESYTLGAMLTPNILFRAFR